MSKATIRPPYSIVFVSDPTHRYDTPDITPGKLVWSTTDCVAIGTLAEVDGMTTLLLESRIEDKVGRVVFAGYIDTPGRMVAISTAETEVVLSIPVPDQRTRVTIWANDESGPDLILVEAG
jgi:hypothetical protein